MYLTIQQGTTCLYWSLWAASGAAVESHLRHLSTSGSSRWYWTPPCLSASSGFAKAFLGQKRKTFPLVKFPHSVNKRAFFLFHRSHSPSSAASLALLLSRWCTSSSPAAPRRKQNRRKSRSTSGLPWFSKSEMEHDQRGDVSPLRAERESESEAGREGICMLLPPTRPEACVRRHLHSWLGVSLDLKCDMTKHPTAAFLRTWKHTWQQRIYQSDFYIRYKITSQQHPESLLLGILFSSRVIDRCCCAVLLRFYWTNL